jgi:hypothetical protein
LANYVAKRDLIFVPLVMIPFCPTKPEDPSFDQTPKKPYSTSIAGQPSLKTIMDDKMKDMLGDTDTTYHPLPVNPPAVPNIIYPPVQYVNPLDTLRRHLEERDLLH